MHRPLLKNALLLIALLCLPAGARAQSADASLREAEWRNYKLPASDFARHFSPSKDIVFRVPIEWQQQGDPNIFKGPGQTELRVVVEEIPDGIPIKSYVAALVTGLRGLPGGADSISIRRTEMSGLEAREILFDLPSTRGVMTRRLIWCAVNGPRAVTILFNTPLASAAEQEPFFKAVVQSVKIIDNPTGVVFDLRHKSAIKDSKPARIDEVLSIADAVEGFDIPARANAVSRLAAIFAASPDSAIELVLDRRPLVRASAIEAIGRSGNRALAEFLCDALSDPDSLVADRAAIALARMPDVIQVLKGNYYSLDGGGVVEYARVAAYLDEKVRVQIATELFKNAASGRPAPSPRPGPPPPPPRHRDAIQVTVPLPPVDMRMLVADRYFVAINLLRNIPADSLRMPIEAIIATDDDRRIAAALQVSLERAERLPVEPLIRLLSSSSEEVRRLAAVSLGESASPADIARIEAAAAKIPPGDKVALELAASIKKIRFIQQLKSAGDGARGDLMKTASNDAQLADWVWSRYLRDELEGPRPAAPRQVDSAPAAIKVAPLGENAFPQRISLYAALPDPGSAFDKLGDSLAGIQMDSARGQAHLVLLLSHFREQAARFLGASGERALIDYSGIKADSPIALATWRAEGSPPATASGERKAFVVAVRDRDRLERVLALYQRALGDFSNLPEYVSIGVRFIGGMPALLPLSAASAIKEPPKERKENDLSYQFFGSDECEGYAVKVIERRKMDPQGRMTADSIYLCYLGDAAVIAPDWHSLRDVLRRLKDGKATIGDSPEFKSAVAAGGDAIYMSDLGEMFGTLTGGKSSGEEFAISESGALRISGAAWENQYRLRFKESKWMRLLAPFKAGDLTAPRELLPHSTAIYIFLSLDLAGTWKEIRDDLLGDKDIKALASAFAFDFEREVLPEIGPECGIAILALPDLGKDTSVPWAVFFKLRSGKLADAFRDGKLFKDSGGASGAPVKIPSTGYFAAVKNGFLVLSDNAATIEGLDAKEYLASTRDYQRSVRNSPEGVIAFGGYNLEAATAHLESISSDPEAVRLIGIMTSVARAFHSQTFYVTASEGGADAKLSVSLDREGRYSVAELSSLAKDHNLTFAFIKSRGAPVGDQKRLEALKIKIRAKGAGAIDRIHQDVASTDQAAERLSDAEMIVTVRPRRASGTRKAQLPISDPEFAAMLQPTREIRSDDSDVIAKAREIAGDDRDAWSVARKLSDWTYKNLKWKRIDDADAAETLATREADCLEFSELFIAMARSLGLPAQLVTGMAYDGAAFGGHAWVEVYVGEWVELDPTWGAEFADATHIRSSSGDLLSYAALNLVDIEVLEARHAVPDYQRDAAALAETLCRELSAGETSALTAALDVAVITDGLMGAGAWSTMSAAERDQMTSAYRRTLDELASGFKKENSFGEPLRLLKMSRSGDRAEALAAYSYAFEDQLVRLNLERRGDIWMLTEVVQVGTDFRIVTEMMEPAVQAILARRSGKPPRAAYLSDFMRVLLTMGEDAKAAIEIADESLKSDPKNRSVRYLRALCLLRAEREDEGLQLLDELSKEEPPMAEALYRLASHYAGEEEKSKVAIELFERYTALMPDDPRGHESLARLHDAQKDPRAEGSHRAAISCDRRNPSRYVDLAAWLASARRYPDAMAAIDEGVKHGASGDEMFASLISRFTFVDEDGVAEAIARAYPERMARNAKANLHLAYARMMKERMRDALPLLKKAAELDPASAEPHTSMAEAYLSLRQYRAALASADAALRIDTENSEAHYHRACALARLGRTTEALAALRLAVELDEDLLDGIEEEEHLKPLARLPEFKKLIRGEGKEKEK